jgi:hypothetical protein
MNNHISNVSVNKKLPGFAPIISFAGTRLSEHPIQSNGLPLAKSLKYSLSIANEILPKLVVV